MKKIDGVKASWVDLAAVHHGCSHSLESRSRIILFQAHLGIFFFLSDLTFLVLDFTILMKPFGFLAFIEFWVLCVFM